MQKEGLSILDLGVGAGGSYMRKDSASTVRVGADTRRNSLTQANRRYGIEVCLLDAQIRQGLPFRSGVFDGVEMFFPHGNLLFGLAASHAPLWSELNRVVTKDGYVKVVFDVPPEGYRVASAESFSTRVYQPENVLWKNATDNGFDVTLKKLDRDDLRALGTQFSNQIAGRLESEPEHSVYLLNATIA